MNAARCPILRVVGALAGGDGCGRSKDAGQARPCGNHPGGLASFTDVDATSKSPDAALELCLQPRNGGFDSGLSVAFRVLPRLQIFNGRFRVYRTRGAGVRGVSRLVRTAASRARGASQFLAKRTRNFSPNGAVSSSPGLPAPSGHPWVGAWRWFPTPTGLWRRQPLACRNPVGVGTGFPAGSQGSSFLATLGWRTQPRWGCYSTNDRCKKVRCARGRVAPKLVFDFPPLPAKLRA